MITTFFMGTLQKNQWNFGIISVLSTRANIHCLCVNMNLIASISTGRNIRGNVAVFQFGHQRALNFARNQNSQAFWIQATDSPPNWYANGYRHEELLEQKKKWLGYNARKTQGILSALLACFDMPYRVTSSHGKDFKKMASTMEPSAV